MSIKSAKVLSEGVSFAGKRALVVGGTAGIGHGIALRLAKAGCAVTIVGRSEERGNAIIDEMTKVSPDSAGGYSHGFTQVQKGSFTTTCSLARIIVGCDHSSTRST